MTIFLETGQLILRQFTTEDTRDLLDINREPEVRCWLPFLPVKQEAILMDIQRYRSFYKKYEGYGNWAVIETSSKRLIGWFMFLPFHEMPYFNPELRDPDDVEIGFYFKKESWGRGYATQVCRSIIPKGFSELGTQCVMATALAANTASIRVMEKSGLTLDKKFTYNELEAMKLPPQEVVIYALSKKTFQAGSSEYQ